MPALVFLLVLLTPAPRTPRPALIDSEWRVVSVERDGAPARDFQITESVNGGPPLLQELRFVSFKRREAIFFVGQPDGRRGHDLHMQTSPFPPGPEGEYTFRLVGRPHRGHFRIEGEELTLTLHDESAPDETATPAEAEFDKPLVIRARAVPVDPPAIPFPAAD